ncbi:MAG: hypothetical protein PF450_11835 [Bacteroidales bacterium]|jgi:hypothetical protein|nr:hypothetical protein [Bacteroidales bacterium]
MSSEIIYSYTREQDLSDGVLIDASQMAKEAGIKYPVALTEALWQGYIVPSEELERFGQSTDGRLWDLLFLFTFYARKVSTPEFQYKCLFLMKPTGTPKTQTIKAHIGSGDQGEPVITLMLPEED